MSEVQDLKEWLTEIFTKLSKHNKTVKSRLTEIERKLDELNLSVMTLQDTIELQ